MKILNLYAGIGGNRKLWKGCEVTAVESQPEIADVYIQLYPLDNVFVGDAHVFLEDHYAEYDFIWSSPPCQTHSQYRHNVGILGKGYPPVMPDMTLYSEIIFLQNYFKGKYVVENVRPYYQPLIPYTCRLGRHCFWTNFEIPILKFEKSNIRIKNKISDFEGHEIVVKSKIKNKRQVLRNRVNSKVGLHLLDSALKGESNDEHL